MALHYPPFPPPTTRTRAQNNIPAGLGAANKWGLGPRFEEGARRSSPAMILSVDRRFSRGVTIGGNYPWSHCSGDQTDSTGDGPNPGQGYSNPSNRDADRGNCVSDRRHLVNLTSVVQTPRFANRSMRILA